MLQMTTWSEKLRTSQVELAGGVINRWQTVNITKDVIRANNSDILEIVWWKCGINWSMGER